MKKLLTILWIFIIGGSIFIAYEWTNPESNTNEEFERKGRDTSLQPIELEDHEQKNYSEYLSLGDDFSQEGNYREAVKNYEEAKKLNPDSPTLLLKLAEAYLRNNEAAKAEGNFVRVNELTPNVEALVGTARAEIALGNIENAKTILESLDRENPKVQYYLALTQIIDEEFDTAEDTLKSIKGENVSSLTRKKTDNILEKFDTYHFYKEGEAAFLNTLLAKGLTENEDYAAAIPLLIRAVNESADYRDAWIVLGYTYLNLDKTVEAIDALKKAETLDDHKPETLFYLGLAYFANDDVDKAIAYLEEAKDRDFSQKDLLKLRLAELYLLQKKYEDASESYEEVISINPQDIDFFTKVVWLNIDYLDNPDKALDYAEKAIERFPRTAMSYNLKGWSLIALERYRDAEKELENALSLNKNFDAPTFNLGLLYEKQGNERLAREYYKKAYILGNGSEIGNLAASHYNKLTEEDKNQYYQVDISAPDSL